MARPQWCALPQASMATMQRGCSAKKPRTFSRESFLRNPTPPSARAPCAWKDRFARSRPIMLTFSMDALSVRGMQKHHHLGTRDAVRRGIHSIKVALSDDVTAEWVLALWTRAPTPAQAARLREATLARLLRQHRIRKLDAPAVRGILRQPAITVAPGVTEPPFLHLRSLGARLRLANQE